MNQQTFQKLLKIIFENVFSVPFTIYHQIYNIYTFLNRKGFEKFVQVFFIAHKNKHWNIHKKHFFVQTVSKINLTKKYITENSEKLHPNSMRHISFFSGFIHNNIYSIENFFIQFLFLMEKTAQKHIKNNNKMWRMKWKIQKKAYLHLIFI